MSERKITRSKGFFPCFFGHLACLKICFVPLGEQRAILKQIARSFAYEPFRQIEV
jgi:hypothetical protein